MLKHVTYVADEIEGMTGRVRQFHKLRPTFQVGRRLPRQAEEGGGGGGRQEHLEEEEESGLQEKGQEGGCKVALYM